MVNNIHETILSIDLNKLEENYLYLKSKTKSKTKIIGVVKAFGYGHGDIEIAKKLEKLGVYALWVTDFEEGINLRKAGIKTKIIVANPGMKSYFKIIKYKLDVIIYNHKLLNLYSSNKNPINIHVKFNTGMNRYGFNKEDIDSIVLKIKENSHLKLLSICSHLSDAENFQSNIFVKKQINLFKKITTQFNNIFNKKILTHILNTHGLLNYNNDILDVVRIGIGLYGCTNEKSLTPIASLNSVITQNRSIKKGERVGYGCSYISKKDMNISIVPVGYADGLNRSLSNGVGKVFVNKKICPIVGKISMGTFAVDTTGVDVEEGDLVEIFGRNISVYAIAKSISTIPYEILSTLNRRIKRIYINQHS